MRRYQNQYGYTINVDPWFNMGYRLVSAELYESLGGDLAYGTLRMIGSQSNLESLMIRDVLYTGTFSILDKGTVVKKFKVFFNSKSYKREVLTLGFICIPDPKYVRDLITQSYNGTLQDIIQSMFTEEDYLDIKCESDIQGEIRLYQTNESDTSFLKKILSGYRRNSVYGYSWDHLIIKETCTPEEIREAPVVEALSEEQSPATKSYTKSLYYNSKDYWSEGYNTLSPDNLRSAAFMGGRPSYVSPQHQDLIMNSQKNIANLGSSYFHQITITLKTLPSYQIGDVVRYYRVDTQHSHLIWPYKYYLVYGNRMFFSTSGTGVTDPMAPRNQGDYTFSTVLVGLEEDGSIALDKTEEQDPTLTLEDQGEPSFLSSTENVGASSSIKSSTGSGIPKITLKA